jgi:hypothetical protein
MYIYNIVQVQRIVLFYYFNNKKYYLYFYFMSVWCRVLNRKRWHSIIIIILLFYTSKYYTTCNIMIIVNQAKTMTRKNSDIIIQKILSSKFCLHAWKKNEARARRRLLWCLPIPIWIRNETNCTGYFSCSLSDCVDVTPRLCNFFLKNEGVLRYYYIKHNTFIIDWLWIRKF